MFDRNNRAKMSRNENQIKSCSMQVEPFEQVEKTCKSREAYCVKSKHFVSI